MSEVIKVLRAEHSNIAQLLTMLERQCVRLAAGQPLNRDIMEAAADYFQSYPDLYHHPKEDLIFQRLKQRDPAAARAFGDLQGEHEEIATRTREFAQSVQAGASDPNGRELLGHWLQSFIAYQREHMAKEERLFFPAALRALTDIDWQHIRARITDQEDPLLGEAIGARYDALRHELLAWDHELRSA